MRIGFPARRSRRPVTTLLARAAAATFESLEDRRLFATFAASADAFVRDGAFANTNFGAAPALFTKNAPGDTREAYLTFDVAAAPSVGTAVLRFNARLQTSTTPDRRVAVYAVPTANWVEGNGTTSNASGDGNDADNSPAGEVTFANRPASSGPAIDVTTVSGDAEQGYAFDVTNYVRAERQAGRSTVSFVVRSLDAGGDYVAYVSSEGGEFGPTLDVTTDAGPSATAAAVADVAPPAGATTDITVTYADPDAVEVLSVSPDDLLVLGPDGQPLNVTAAVTAGSTSGTPLVVTYTVAAPGGSWDDADAGTYSVRLAANQVSDVLENVAPPGELTTFRVGTATPPPGGGPTASFATDPVAGGAATHPFTVTYSDPDNVSRASIGAGNVTVTGPGGPLTVTGASAVPGADSPSLTVTYTVAAPGGFWDAADNGTYTVALAAGQVRDAAGNAAAAAASLGTFTAAVVGDVRMLVGAFGAGTQNPRGLTFPDADGTPVTITLKGGQGQLFVDGGAYELELTGTNGASALSVKTRAGGDGRFRLGDSSATGGLKSITAKTTDLAGTFATGGPLGKATIGNATGATLAIGGGGQVAITLGDATNFSIDSDSVIRSVKANAWTDDDGQADLISAPDFGTLSVRGNFGADVDAASVRSVKVGGALVGSSIRTAGNVGRVTAAGMTGSRILAGVNGTALPQSAGDFANAGASIGGVTIRGTFGDSLIAAPTVGRLALGTVQTSNNGAAFGVAADRAASLTATAGNALRLTQLDDPSESTTTGDFVVRIV